MTNTFHIVPNNIVDQFGWTKKHLLERDLNLQPEQ